MVQETRMMWLDALRLAAGISMVGLHATSDASGQPFVDHAPAERIAPMLLRAVLYVARTELFIIIALFLLLMSLERRPRGYRQVIGEQVHRLLVPFLFWTIFYAAYNLIKAGAFGYADAHLREVTSLLAWVGYLTLGDVKYHMHFLPTLFGIVLFYPVYRQARRIPALGLLVLLGLAVKQQLDAFLWQAMTDHPLLPYFLRATKVLTYLGYGMAAGALLGLWQTLDRRQMRHWAMPLAWMGGLLFLIKLAATWRTIATGRWPFDYGPGFWADFLMPVALFALAMSLSSARWPEAFARAAPYSFGIYLCHPIFLDLFEIWLKPIGLSPTAQVAIKIAGTLTATVLFVRMLARVRPLAWTIGLGSPPWRRVRRTPLALEPEKT